MPRPSLTEEIEECERNLLTLDYKGVEAKRAYLDRLLAIRCEDAVTLARWIRGDVAHVTPAQVQAALARVGQ